MPKRRSPPPWSVDIAGTRSRGSEFLAPRRRKSILRRSRKGYDGREAYAQTDGGVMWVLAILIAAASFYFGAHDVALAQAATPNVTPPFTGLSTPITSTVTNCMMSCNSQAANCHTGCFIPAAPTSVSAGRGTLTSTLNATSNTACIMGCTSSRLACHTSCSLLASQIGR
jgi:hypothetical protein